MQTKLINFVAQNLKLYNQFCYVGHSCLACTIAHFWQIFSHPSQELGINRMGGVEAHKSVNLKYITVGWLDDDMIVPPSDGAMFILIDWE